jgi:ferredoxin
MSRRAHGAHLRLRVDIVACEGVGICGHLAPDLVRVDSWGFPILDDSPLTVSAERQARAAVRACPRRALFLADARPTV